MNTDEMVRSNELIIRRVSQKHQLTEPQTEELVSVKLSRASWPLSNKEKKSALPLTQAVVTLFESMYVERCLGLSLISSAHKG